MKFTSFLLAALLNTAAQAQNAPDSTAKQPVNTTKQKGLTVFPARIVFNVDKGGTASKTINVSNYTEKTYQLSIEFRDWIRDTVGKHIYTSKGNSPQSCASWLRFDKSLLELKPGENTDLIVTLDVPDEDSAVEEMKWTMLVVRTVSEKRPPSLGAKVQTNIETIFGIGVHVLQTPPNIRNKELKMLSFSELPGDGRSYRVTCKNIGGVEINARFSIELASAETGFKRTLEPQPIPMFPRQNRYVDFVLPADIPKGTYTAIALVDAEDDNVPIEAAEKQIIVK
jgi:hypothetical protein